MGAVSCALTLQSRLCKSTTVHYCVLVNVDQQRAEHYWTIILMHISGSQLAYSTPVIQTLDLIHDVIVAI